MQARYLDGLADELYKSDAGVSLAPGAKPEVGHERSGFLGRYLGRAWRYAEGLACAGLVGLALAGGAGEANASPINSNSVVKDNIEYHMQTDKSTYNLGENVEMLYRVSNLGSEDVDFEFFDTIQRDFIVQSKIGENFNEIWRWTYSGGGAPVFTEFSLSPNEFKEFKWNWPQIDAKGTISETDDAPATIGTYKILGCLTYGYESDSKVGVEINIVPEPYSLTLLGGGIFGLATYTKRKK